ncbi:hypothetical protein [Haloferax sp. DFSO52]|uniref:DUF7261 family protein n=1 Tax=Haloferax sp. DFSO52 TaxID=3388505 RepID=UPI003A8B1B2D
MASLMRNRRDDRGQLLLVGAFILAILLVALAVVLNAAIYTETLAARGNDRADVFDTVEYRDDTEHALAGLVDSVNDDAHVSRTAAEANITAGVTAWDTISAREQAATGRATSVTVTDVDVLTSVSQTNASLSFTNASGTTDWTLFQSVNSTQSSELSVDSATAELDSSNVTTLSVLEDKAFYVELNNTTTSWQVFVFQSPWDVDNATVVVHSEGTFATYNVSQSGTDSVDIDLVNGTVDGTDDLILSSIDGDTVRFVNGNQAIGTYTLVVEDDVASESDYAATADDGPTARAVVTKLDVILRYELPNLEYETPISVTGGAENV